MSDAEDRGIAETIEDLERRLPSDDPLRCVTNALRECDRGLVQQTILGDTDAQPIVWSRFIALGNVEGRPHPCYGIYPGIVDDDDRREVERVGEVLKRRKVALMPVEDISPLKVTGILTAALALFGEDRDGHVVLVIARHPDVTAPQANCLLLAAVMEAADAQVRRN